MHKVLIFGNSGSGKSTLAKILVKQEGLAYLDLDRLAWLPENPPKRAPLAKSRDQIKDFMDSHTDWVIEGCYTDLLEIAAPLASKAIFMNLSISQCLENAKNRPWEPHKYENKEAQDSNFEMLINWIKDYREREDEFSYRSHMKFYERFEGTKFMYTENQSHT